MGCVILRHLNALGQVLVHTFAWNSSNVGHKELAQLSAPLKISAQTLERSKYASLVRGIQSNDPQVHVWSV